MIREKSIVVKAKKSVCCLVSSGAVVSLATQLFRVVWRAVED